MRSYRHRCFLGLFALIFLSTPFSLLAIVPVDTPPEGYSILDHVPDTLPAGLAEARLRGLEALQQDLPGVPLRFEWQPNGAFAFLRNAEPGVPLIRRFARPEPGAASSAARAFVEKYAGLFGLDRETLGTLVLDRDGVIGKTQYGRGVYYVSFTQKVGGVRVHKARLTFAIHVRTGDLYAVTSNIFGSPDLDAAKGYRLRVSDGAVFSLKAVGLEGVAKNITRKGARWEVSIDGATPDESFFNGAAFEGSGPDTSAYDGRVLDGPVTVEKAFLNIRPGRFVPGYVAYIWDRARGLLEVGVDARDGRHLLTTPRTSNLEANLSVWPNYPMAADGTKVAPSMVQADPDPVASPNGWIAEPGDDGLYRTIGPNVVSFYDWEDAFGDYEFVEGMRPYTSPATAVSDTGDTQEITFDYRDQWGSEDPTDYVQLSVVENFWHLNKLHDHYYQIGFTETEGNFQGDDPIIANVQNGYDLGSRNNANFSTPPDGMSGRMNLYVFDDETGELRDGAIDKHAFTHESGHGLSNRLVNFGDNYLRGAQSGAFGEGMADVFAFMHDDPLETRSDAWALAPYLGWEYFTYVRRGPLTYMVTGNFANNMLTPMGRFTAYTYETGDTFDIQDDRAQRTFAFYGALPVVWIEEGARGNRYVGYFGDWSYFLSPETHSDGEIWSAALWRIRRRVEKQTWTVSMDDRLVALEQTFLMGMQIMPYNPTFIQARDALLIYEEMTQSQSAVCLMESEFARNGMGKNAYGGPNGSYGSADHWDSETQTFPYMTSDYDDWGCEPGTYDQASGEVLMVYTSPAVEVEVGKETYLDLKAMTPGYNTVATVSGPFIGTITTRSDTDTLLKTYTYTPTSVVAGHYACTVTSTQGQSETQTLDIRSAVAIELDANFDQDESYVELDANNHYKVFIEASTYVTGDMVTATLTSLDELDIDFYSNINTLALPSAAYGYDADEDGNEVLKLQKTDTGWQVVNSLGSKWAFTASDEGFYFYLDVAGFTASNYRLTVERGKV